MRIRMERKGGNWRRRLRSQILEEAEVGDTIEVGIYFSHSLGPGID